MNKSEKIHRKQEKQIVKLMYQKGIIDELCIGELKDLYWADYRIAKGKYNNGRYNCRRRHYEVHYWTTDYWGEGNEHSLVDHYLELLYWSKYEYCEYDESKRVKIISRKKLIKDLKKLKTIHNDKKINQVIKRVYCDF
jgi:hypothetical protein